MWDILVEWGLGHLKPTLEASKLLPQHFVENPGLSSQVISNKSELALFDKHFKQWLANYVPFETSLYNSPLLGPHVLQSIIGTDFNHHPSGFTNHEMSLMGKTNSHGGVAQIEVNAEYTLTNLDTPLHNETPNPDTLPSHEIPSNDNLSENIQNNNETNRESLINTNDTPLMIYDFLKKDVEGKAIIKSYVNKKFNSKMRNLLVRRLINREKVKAFENVPVEKKTTFHLSAALLKNYAEEISTVFQTEKPTVYFMPYESKNGIKIGPSGKLVAHYHYVVGDLRKKGLIGPDESPDEPLIEPNVDANTTVTDEIDDFDNNITVLTSLQQQEDTTILASWKATFPYRKGLLVKEKISVSEYYERFHVLQAPIGSKLISSDFHQLFQDVEKTFEANWTNLKKKLITFLERNRTKLKNIEDKTLSNSLWHIKEEADRDAIIWYLQCKR